MDAPHLAPSAPAAGAPDVPLHNLPRKRLIRLLWKTADQLGVYRDAYNICRALVEQAHANLEAGRVEAAIEGLEMMVDLWREGEPSHAVH